ncbi:MAG: undecaprenyl-diphosphate phosphatase [Candidatus Hydrogenedens sp.]|nr:undecaprenyl-diphosphate phosphatase [Candidatus Hydrogenedens sp.]
MSCISVIIFGLVEGLTEFLPVSSTGHMILLEEWLSLPGSPAFAETFRIVVQLPAILAVVLYFWKRLWPFSSGTDFNTVFLLWVKICVAFLPAAVIGFFLDDYLEAWFFNPTSISIALIIGGIVLLLLEKRPPETRFNRAEEIGFRIALAIGFFQCLAMMPGTSRSAATIIGAMILGASRPAAAEFSFFLAIPTMLGATAYKTVKTGLDLSTSEWGLIAVGGIVAFVTAWLVVASFMAYIQKRPYAPFAWYRMVLGVVILALLGLGYL